MDMKREYYEDIELFSSGTILFWTIVLLAALFTVPFFATQYHIYLFNLIMVHIIVAVGLNILVGSTGQIALGHAGVLRHRRLCHGIADDQAPAALFCRPCLRGLYRGLFWLSPRLAGTAT
jgi:hypothetical protein